VEYYVNTWAPGINGQLKMKFVSHITLAMQLPGFKPAHLIVPLWW
jgi:hypothetical protein